MSDETRTAAALALAARSGEAWVVEAPSLLAPYLAGWESATRGTH